MGSSSVLRQAPLLGLEAQLLLHLVDELVGQVERAVLGAARRVLLAQRVPLPPGRHEQPVEVGVAGDADAEHVPELALVPVGGGPHAGHRVHARRVLRQRHLEAHVRVPAVGDEVVEDAERGVGLALAVQPLALVDAAEVVEHRERLGGLLAPGTPAPRRDRSAGTQAVGMPSAVACSTKGTSGKRSRSSREHGRRRGFASAGRRPPATGSAAGRPESRAGARPRLRPGRRSACARASSITSRPGAAACRSPRRRRGAGRAWRCRAA